MKVGIRKPNLKKSIKARTTGKVKRKLKKTVNPLYGKKGMGMIKNPKRAIKGKIYRATTVDALKPLRSSGSHKKTRTKTSARPNQNMTTVPASGLKKTKLVWGIVLAAVGLIGLTGCNTAKDILVFYIIFCLLIVAAGVVLIILYVKDKKAYDLLEEQALEQAEREQYLEDAKLELEQAKVDSELKKLHAEQTGVKVCPACGANTKGSVCEYCGSRLV